MQAKKMVLILESLRIMRIILHFLIYLSGKPLKQIEIFHLSLTF